MSTDQINQPIHEEHIALKDFIQHCEGIGQFVFSNIRTLFATFVQNVEMGPEKGAKLWTGSQLSNGSFYLYPSKEPDMPDKLRMSFSNGYMCEVSCKVAGIITTLYLMNHLTWLLYDAEEKETDPNRKQMLNDRNEMVIDLYYKLRDFAIEHEYRDDILSAID